MVPPALAPFLVGFPVGCACVHSTDSELCFRWGGLATGQTELELKGDEALHSQPAFIISAGHVLRALWLEAVSEGQTPPC